MNQGSVFAKGHHLLRTRQFFWDNASDGFQLVASIQFITGMRSPMHDKANKYFGIVRTLNMFYIWVCNKWKISFSILYSNSACHLSAVLVHLAPRQGAIYYISNFFPIF